MLKHERAKAFALQKRGDSLRELLTSKSVTSDFTVAQIISSKHLLLYPTAATIMLSHI